MRTDLLNRLLVLVIAFLTAILAFAVFAPDKKSPKIARMEVVQKDDNGRWTIYRDTKTGYEYMKVADGGIIRLDDTTPKEMSEMLQKE